MPAITPQRVSDIEKIDFVSAITISDAATIPVPPPKQPP